MDYLVLRDMAARQLATYGTSWTITRNGLREGTVMAVRTEATNSAKKTGLVLAADRAVQLILAATPEVKPGDRLTNGTETYTVATVSQVRPGTTTIVQRVEAS